jgi:hypothetical protein
MKKRGSWDYFLAIVVVVAFVSVIFYGVDDYTGYTVYSKCEDSDGGLNYDVKGVVSLTKENNFKLEKKDNCRSRVTLREMSCKDNQPETNLYDCAYGCDDGRCKGSEGKGDLECGKNECLYNNACYPRGTRLLTEKGIEKYCDSSYFIAQKHNGEGCSLNFECLSDNCVKAHLDKRCQAK